MIYFKVLIKKLWLVILIPLLLLCASIFYFFFKQVPLYQAETKLIVVNKSGEDSNNKATITYNDLLAGQVFVKNYKELIKSRLITSEVKKELNLNNITEEKLGQNIDVDLITDSNMLMITAINEDPQKAMQIANKASEVFINKAIELMSVKNISVVDYAVTPSTPMYLKKIQNVVVVTFLGLVFSLSIIFLIAFYDDSIGNIEEIEIRHRTPVIGLIPQIKK